MLTSSLLSGSFQFPPNCLHKDFEVYFTYWATLNGNCTGRGSLVPRLESPLALPSDLRYTLVCNWRSIPISQRYIDCILHNHNIYKHKCMIKLVTLFLKCQSSFNKWQGHRNHGRNHPRRSPKMEKGNRGIVTKTVIKCRESQHYRRNARDHTIRCKPTWKLVLNKQ
jgi:hypothetical protein